MKIEKKKKRMPEIRLEPWTVKRKRKRKRKKKKRAPFEKQKRKEKKQVKNRGLRRVSG
jgi:hypothetical protein